jgi:putative transposase
MYLSTEIENRFVYDISWPVCRGKEVLVGEVAAYAADLLAKAGGAHPKYGPWRILEVHIEPGGVVVRAETGPLFSPHLLAREIKAATSPVLRKKFPHLRKLPSLWTREYQAVSVTPNPTEEVQS